MSAGYPGGCMEPICETGRWRDLNYPKPPQPKGEVMEPELYNRAEWALLELTETICEIHGQYKGRYYWLYRLLEWTADKLIWR